LRTYSNAPTFTLYPPFNATTLPEAILERPTKDETVRGVMRVSGIAYDPGFSNQTFLSRVDVFVDGIERSVVSAALARPDYCATNQVPGCPTVGFQSELNLAPLGLSPGPHTIWVRATNSRGASKE